MDKVQISFIIPCRNEEGNVFPFYELVKKTFRDDLSGLELIFIDDGSDDGTGERLKSLYRKHRDHVRVIRFSRAFGKESAVLAGLEKATGTYTVIIDADLQQDPAYVLNMLEYLEEHEEYDVVCCIQEDRKESFLRKFLKKSFYKTMNALSEVNVKNAASDFRLMRRCVVDAILQMKESKRFLKGIFAWVGFNTCYMPYRVEKRHSGVSKWGTGRLFKYALQGILSFSDLPLLLSLRIGAVLLFLSAVWLVVLLVQAITGAIGFSNNMFVIASVLFTGSLVLISNGIIGKYLASVYAEAKRRPQYIVKEYLDGDREA